MFSYVVDAMVGIGRREGVKQLLSDFHRLDGPLSRMLTGLGLDLRGAMVL